MAKAVLTIPADSVAVCGPSCHLHAAGVHQAKAGLFQQLAEFLGGLLDTKNWPARWHCGTWSDFHGWLYILSDITIWASYFIISFLLVRMIKKRTDIPFPRVIWLFGAFIILCGVTHLLDAVIFWWPAYRLSAFVRLLTAIVSAISVYALYKVMPSIFSLRTVKDLEHEIGERKEVEEKLARSEFILEEAGRIARLGGWEYDVFSGKNTWSPTVYQIYEVDTDFDIDGSDPYAFFIEPYGQQLKEAVEQAYHDGNGWDLELQLMTAKGNRLWVRSCGECFYNDEGQVAKLRGMCIDIDRYKTAELDLHRSHELLFQSNQQLKSFTHILSHNIRNHASNISLLSQLVETEILDENNADLFDKMMKVSRGLNTTLDDLAEAIKIRENTIEPEVISFRDAAGNVIEVMESAIINSGTSIKYDFKAETVKFPRLYFESILMNLISNSMKYKKEDMPPRIVLKSYFDEGGRTVLECIDNGLGIDLNLHGAKIFGLYKTFHYNAEAHGVGLFLMKTQIESQGGSISVKSKPGHGAAFKIIFN